RGKWNPSCRCQEMRISHCMVPHGGQILRSVLCITLLAGFVVQLSAQEVPPDTTSGQTAQQQTEQQQTERVVDGRPALYSLKRAIHPVTWLEAGVRPIIRSAESGML